MKWYEYAQNPQAIISLFNELYALDEVRFSSIRLSARTGEFALFADLSRLPEKVPSRWHGKNYTAAQVEVRFFCVKALDIMGWGADEVFKVSIQPEVPELFRFFAKSDNCQLQFVFAALRIEGVTPYDDGLRKG